MDLEWLDRAAREAKDRIERLYLEGRAAVAGHGSSDDGRSGILPGVDASGSGASRGSADRDQATR
ncbi:hypothetical protein LZG04_39005 [Saccharothrix sp. S26]|uniref:hypothetical protein n=1 Tax=Saccharothrix sp. S26 TaxID=2907215 RepID=UPI001F3363DE|nr:hypothetical protein [Saccharothrix sp. S26]MCE7000764.1 hypothetical protein [Saccharothrix sp. S26]